jgi:hypothetical protein
VRPRVQIPGPRPKFDLEAVSAEVVEVIVPLLSVVVV